MAYRILIVDDEIEVVTMLQSFLLRNGYQVSCASNGAETISKAAEQPDLILLDFYMMGLDGVETLEKMNELPGFDIPVVMLTSISTKPLEENCRRLGAAAFLPKPFLPEELRKTIQEIFEQKLGTEKS